MKKLYVVIIMCVVSMLGLFFLGREAYAYYRYHHVQRNITKADIDKINLDGYNKLMIVAHPDDETIWAGAHLIKDDYFVVCMTNKSNKVRNAEFHKAIEFSNDRCMMLDYPDKIFNQRSDWDNIETNIKADVKTLVEYKNWDCIVTHNKDGEYGHQHHKSLNKFVTHVVEDENQLDKLQYFGKFYEKKDFEANKDKLIPIDENLLKKKKEMLKVYKSQSFIEGRYGHMYGYEHKF